MAFKNVLYFCVMFVVSKVKPFHLSNPMAVEWLTSQKPICSAKLDVSEEFSKIKLEFIKEYSGCFKGIVMLCFLLQVHINIFLYIYCNCI